MPLSNGTSNAAREENVKREIAAGKDPKQAVAIAYSKQRENASKTSDGNAPALQALTKDIIADLKLLSQLLSK